MELWPSLLPRCSSGWAWCWRSPFIETPLKFRAPGVTLPIGLGVGRLVFRALNACELALAAVVVACFAITPPTTVVAGAAAVAVVTLLAQVLAVRPRLTRRSDAVLAGGEGPRSRAHWAYVGLEMVKVIALLIAGISLLWT
jgi:hypothetical protein